MKRGESSIILAQRAYALATQRARDGLVVPEAFVRGIRHLGYKSNVEAIAELVDNSIQAYAERIDLVLGYANSTSTTKPTQIAVIDDGHGMDRGMLRFAMMWGGTHRENDRSGLGRFGYGLPCATVSIGRRFTIYSKVRGGKTHAVTLDLDLLDDGEYRAHGAALTLPPARPARLPEFVREAIVRDHPGGWPSGTVVLIEKLDRLDWVTSSGMQRNLVRHFGVAYHKLLGATSVNINGERVRPIDPLFLSPEAEFFGIDDDRAQALDPVTLKTGDGDAQVTLRYAWLPPTFGSIDKSRDAIGINANARFSILKLYHGVVFSRNGRVVDVQSRTPWTTFINNDRYIRVEVEFSATLDDAFGVTTSKQQVSVSPEMWDRLRVAGLAKAIEHLRGKVRSAKAARLQMLSAPGERRGQVHLRMANTASSDAAKPAQELECLIRRDELEALIERAVGQYDPADALRSLLNHLRRKVSSNNLDVAAEFEHLLRGWAQELFDPIAGPKR